MPARLTRLANRAAETLAIRTGWAKHRFRSSTGQFRVLAYHGLVPDGLADRPWVPPHYVTVSQFERQMNLLASFGSGTVRPLGEVVNRCQRGGIMDEPVVCLTFDDGFGDNVSLALPILRQRDFRASFFLTTGYMGGDRLLANDRIRLLRQVQRGGRLEGPLSPFMQAVLAHPGFHKQHNHMLLESEIEPLWSTNMEKIDPAAVRSLRMMSWEDAACLRDAGMEIGSHTVNHVILGREDLETRQREITRSIAEIAARLGLDRVPFSYPNGLAGDFGPDDVICLQALNVPYAVTELPGCNTPSTSVWGLRRHCVGLHTSEDVFLAQVCGLRDGRLSAPERTIR
ncbi:MAG: polysaccharide deacetylase family protein [Phycisphaerae bacterium]|nr:polysaccharide deacetylase family protein [Phycisphaerae bacterium]